MGEGEQMMRQPFLLITIVALSIVAAISPLACFGRVMGDPSPKMSQAQRQENSNGIRDAFFCVISSWAGLMVLIPVYRRRLGKVD